MMMSEKKFKVGDRVRVKGRTCISTVMYMKDGWVSVDTPIKTAEAYPEDDVEYVDPRTAFMQDLKNVLEKHNAKIVAGHGSGLCLIIGSKAIIARPDHETEVIKITPDNIMDYDKK